MPRFTPRTVLTRFQHYRKTKLSPGMKVVRICVPDPNTPGFTAEARAQAHRLRNAPEEAEVLDFIEDQIE